MESMVFFICQDIYHLWKGVWAMKIYADVTVVGCKRIRSKNGKEYAKVFLTDSAGDLVEFMTNDLAVLDKQLYATYRAEFDYVPYSGKLYLRGLA